MKMIEVYHTAKVSCIKILFLLLFTLVLFPNHTFSQKVTYKAKPDSTYSWDKFSFTIGGFLTQLNSDILLGNKQLGLGIAINLEDALGLETSSLVLRSEIEYNFGRRNRHAVRIAYFGFFRSARKILETEIEIEDETYPIGAEINSRFDLQIFQAAYEYAFLVDPRVKLSASGGFFVMPINFSVNTMGQSERRTKFVAPLPVVGLHAKFGVTPKLMLVQEGRLLYLEISNLTGSITDVNIRMEYNPWKHIGFGLGVNSYRLRISSEQDGKILGDFVGKIKTGYTGLLFYAKYSF